MTDAGKDVAFHTFHTVASLEPEKKQSRNSLVFSADRRAPGVRDSKGSGKMRRVGVIRVVQGCEVLGT